MSIGSSKGNPPDFRVRSTGFGQSIRHVRETDSTNRLAREWAGEGAPDGAVVVADHQTRGRGRLGRQWESSPGQNLLLTAIVKAREPLLSDHAARGMLPLTASLAVADTLERFVPASDIAIKWPNDVLLAGRKCSGILVEEGPAHSFLIGIGLNLHQAAFSDEVADKATSVLLHSGRRVDRAEVFDALMNHLDRWIPLVFERDRQPILGAYTRRLAGLDAPVEIATGSGTVRGILAGIQPDGGLVVDTPSGRNVYYAGDVSLSHFD